MRTPTSEQEAVLIDTSRIKVIRAVPGSGKTWLVAELIRKEIEHWTTKHSGIAALSFTRVGGDEIRQALGYEIEHPHFVGTIDAFLFRYVVRPYFCSCFPNFAAPHIVPGEWGIDRWNHYEANQTVIVGKGINLFSCVFIGEDQGKAIIAHKKHLAGSLEPLTGDDLIKVKKGKWKLWEMSGCLTHSDAAFWASKILENKTYGSIIRAEIVRRFPLIIVDELQDTGFYLGKCIHLLLNENSVRSVLVGDPDQAIFEFNGARPVLFNEFETISGAKTLPLANSRRCPSTITKAANYLKDSTGIIGPADNKTGKAFLVRYYDMKSDIAKIASATIKKYPNKNIKIIARSNDTVTDLIGCKAITPPRIGCPSLFYIHLAVTNFRQGHQIAALANSRTAINLATFGREAVTDQKLIENQIDPFDWKSLYIRCLLKANIVPISGTVFDWQMSAGQILEAEIKIFVSQKSLTINVGKLKPQQRTDWDKPSTDYLPKYEPNSSLTNNISIQTVHSVKGQTHDVTIFVCPPTNRSDHCPSVIWWSQNDKDREEKRIAYVAMTRTQGDLVFCVSEPCFQRLSNNHPQFVESFDCMTVDNYSQLYHLVT
jgi:DNA helicase II / ATP-dependent DNA helicase PcrA